jgi:uncharacterized protein (DUF983 family)
MGDKPNMFITGITQKCPNCGKGNLFVNPNPYNYRTMDIMNGKCSNCGTSFKGDEPGFYWGSMFVSYFISVGIVLINLLWIQYFFGWNIPALLIPNILFILLFAPLNFRISRSLWLGLNVRLINKSE